MTTPDIDIAICGAGPVGMALAALLVRRGHAAQRIALVDARTVAQAGNDPRSIALSHGSRQLLEEIGVWPIEATAIHQIHVSRRGHFGRSMIERDDHQLPALGYVARYGALVTALGAVCRQLGVTELRPARVEGSTEHEHSVTLVLENRPALETGLLVQAEGGLFGAQREGSVRRDYGQSAIIAQVQASAMIAHRAYERFTDEGPLALLPQGDAYALVWCVRPDTAQRLLALDDGAFLAELGTAFGERVGRFTGTSKRVAYPLGLNSGASFTRRGAAIGNAAQTLHPVAGQGLNLGLRDAAVLARLLAGRATPEQLQQYTQLRSADRQLTVRLTDAMARIFAGNTPGQALLGLSLGLIDSLPVARKTLAELMMYGRR
ncbi:FAD-dependent monooxygenase [Janthinobacterium agaricidamnosum]|uniref:Ubiquinone biosynthesis hydroxylase, UbiH/UbiF/VisC/COQ6 family protein n=1 Tax=Janthinobacterium agaricidamnosum NBRC 102515 = DSM 9628 TaxID=1349767 RepID=W0V096_9BURK|nr:FAD-dependent monooxygenase [Janthinobacterium agaricidamnosum]CDG81030.1 ubiquinone biosynthesis hydroxylase, UbiH/UbiF/VisC/COQ6 family protein [Janthinobacterium agaricidamnosum NBRC 102515 = DSM 9628]